MKKIIAIVLVMLMSLSFASCKKNETENVVNTPSENEEILNENEETTPSDEEQDTTEEVEEDKEDGEAVKPSAKPEENPQTKPEEKPETTPETKPEEKPVQNQSVGNILLNDFKSMASSSNDSLSIAEGLLKNSVIAFSGAAMPVEPGYLNGFDGEIKGFKEGTMFAPVIGTIPFVGYVFTLENASEAASFIASLKSSANLRWNICTEADEMVTGSVDNKVFFVMCPKSFDEE